MAENYLIGCAGWSLPKAVQPAFSAAGSHLERYGSRLPAVEINTSFYRPHRPETYARWAASVPAGFRFAVKVPRAITHERRLRGAEEALAAFLAEAGALGGRLGCLLVQLPPSLAFDGAVAGAFLSGLRSGFAGSVALEPRHASWFSADAETLLVEHRVARVAADPARFAMAGDAGGWPGLVYFRLHGAPRIYYSNYDEARLDALAERLHAAAGSADEVWCIFDNTAEGAATANALGLLERLAGSP